MRRVHPQALRPRYAAFAAAAAWTGCAYAIAVRRVGWLGHHGRLELIAGAIAVVGLVVVCWRSLVSRPTGDGNKGSDGPSV